MCLQSPGKKEKFDDASSHRDWAVRQLGGSVDLVSVRWRLFVTCQVPALLAFGNLFDRQTDRPTPGPHPCSQPHESPGKPDGLTLRPGVIVRLLAARSVLRRGDVNRTGK